MVWLVVLVISRDPVMLLSLLKLSVVWVSMFVLLVCTVGIFFFFGCGVFCLGWGCFCGGLVCSWVSVWGFCFFRCDVHMWWYHCVVLTFLVLFVLLACKSCWFLLVALVLVVKCSVYLVLLWGWGLA